MNPPYDVILADPPWDFKTYSDKGKGRSAERHYEVMDIEDVLALPVQTIAAPDCALFLWSTCPHLPQALAVMQTWGFAFKTVAFTWIKITSRRRLAWGTGYWTRANAELCLLGTRGSPKRVATDVHSVILAPRREHSRKPDQQYERIERLLGDVRRVELFARPPHRPNWDVWGLEAQPDAA